MSEHSGGSPVYFNAWVQSVEVNEQSMMSRVTIDIDTKDLLRVIFVGPEDEGEILVNLKEKP